MWTLTLICGRATRNERFSFPYLDLFISFFILLTSASSQDCGGESYLQHERSTTFIYNYILIRTLRQRTGSTGVSTGFVSQICALREVMVFSSRRLYRLDLRVARLCSLADIVVTLIHVPCFRSSHFIGPRTWP